MKNYRRTILASLALLALAGVAWLTTLKAADLDDRNDAAITIRSLAGPWQMTLFGVGGCGTGTSVVNFTLNDCGLGSTVVKGHTSGCGDPSSSGNPFVIQSLNPDGSGTANLSCGPGCGWNLIIQVAKNRQIFNVVDVDPLNGGNYLEGTAIHQ